MKSRITKKAVLYFVLRFVVIGVMVLKFVERDWFSAFLCVLTLLLFMIPSFLEKRLNIELPTLLEYIILLFIFSAEILGEINRFYLRIPYWDTILHTLNGFIMAGIGLSMIDILNRHDSLHFKMSQIFVCLVAFCFSMTVGVLWEFFEYGMDTFTHTDMQKDTYVNRIDSVDLNPSGENVPLAVEKITAVTVSGTVNGEETTLTLDSYLDVGLNDTMEDLFVNCIGALVFSFFGYFYLNGRSKFASGFIPRLKSHKEDKDEN